MSIINVNKETCLKDGLCIGDCPAKILKADEDGFPLLLEKLEEGCINCGHCVAVCPVGAMDHKNAKAEDCIPIQKEKIITPEQAEQFLLSRRSIRQYRKKPVEREQIEKLLQIAGYGPSGHNFQPTRWIVVMDKKEVHTIGGMVADWMRWMIVHQPEMAKMLHLEEVVAAWDGGQDLILRDAPHLAIAYAHKKDSTAPAAITTAIAYLELAAPSLGVGTCWAGYLTAACQTYDVLQKALDLPEGQAVYGGVMLGYPKVKYRRVPKRKKIDVVWR